MNKLLLVDDHEIIRNGISYYFEDNPNIEVQAQATDGLKALEELEKQSFDIMLTDISMPGVDGIELIQKARKLYPKMKIIAFTMHSEAHLIKQVLKENVDGYVLKNSGKKQLLEAIDAVLRDDEYFDEQAAKSLINDLTKKPQKKERLVIDVELSKRELEILKLVVDEESNQEIADKLFISIRTVETHKRNILDKTGCKNIAGLVMYAVERNLV